MQTITVNLNLSRGSCRINQPLYLGETVALSFTETGAYSLILTEPFADSPKDGIVVWAQSTASGELTLNRNALHNAFKKAEAMQPNMTVTAKCFVISEDGQTVADSEVAIEYSPKAFVIDDEDYPLAKELLLQATSAKDQAIHAKDSAIDAKDSAIDAKSAAETAKLKAEDAKTAAEKARDEAKDVIDEIQEAKTDAERASNSAKESAVTSFLAKESAEETAETVKTALGRMTASARQVYGGVEVLLWNGQGNKPMPIFIPNGIDGVTGYVKCDEDGRYYCLKCKEVDGEKVLALEQVGVDNVNIEGYVRAVNGHTPDETGNVVIPLNFLPLSGGGIITSTLAMLRNVDDSFIAISGGSNYHDGAILELLGKNHPSGESARITVHDKENNYIKKQFICSSSGSLMWDGENIVRAINGVSANSKGSVDISKVFLLLSGGTLSGGVTFNKNVYIKKTDDTGYLALSGGTGYDGGGVIVIRGKNDTEGNKGEVYLRVNNGTNECILRLLPDGKLTWGEKNVTLEGDCLPLTGGTLTGDIKTTGDSISREFVISGANDKNSIRISGGTGLYNGASLFVYGKTHAEYPSSFRLTALDGNQQPFQGINELIGRPDGTLHWNGSQVFLPVGAVFAYAGSGFAIQGCLLCDGGAVSRKKYARLFAAIGTRYGSGDGSTTFNLPNLMDRFIQGSDSAGTYKEAGLPNITGTFSGILKNGADSSDSPDWDGAMSKDEKYSAGNGGGDYRDYYAAKFDASKSNAIYGNSDTVQPPALTMMYYIKY